MHPIQIINALNLLTDCQTGIWLWSIYCIVCIVNLERVDWKIKANVLVVFRLRNDFKQLLEETGYVTPGKKLEEVRVLFMGRECWEALPEIERQQIYEIHQQELILRSKKNFQELLLEKADLFYQFRSSPAGTVTQDDIMEITDTLAEDGRFKALDRFDADRKLLLFQVMSRLFFYSSFDCRMGRLRRILNY